MFCNYLVLSTSGRVTCNTGRSHGDAPLFCFNVTSSLIITTVLTTIYRDVANEKIDRIYKRAVSERGVEIRRDCDNVVKVGGITAYS